MKIKNSKGKIFNTIGEAIDDLGKDGGWVEIPKGRWSETVKITEKNKIKGCRQ